MTQVTARTTARIGAALLLAGILMAWYSDAQEISIRPAYLIQTIGALLLTVGLYAGIS